MTEEDFKNAIEILLIAMREELGNNIHIDCGIESRGTIYCYIEGGDE